MSILSSTLVWIKFQFIKTPFWRNKSIVAVFILGVLTNILIWILWNLYIAKSGYPVFIPFSLPQVNLFIETYLLPLSGSFIIILNLILALYAYRKETLASYFLVAVNFFIQILILLFFFFFIKFALQDL